MTSVQEAAPRKPGLLRRSVDKVQEINRRYATPRIRMSRSVKVVLLLLRLYLFFLVGLLVFRLVTGRG